MDQLEIKTCGIFRYSLNDQGSAVIRGANEWPEVLVIPEQLDGHPVTEIGLGAFNTDDVMSEVGLYWNNSVPMYQLPAKYMDQIIHDIAMERIKEVQLPETLERIEACAFYCCMNLGKVNFPKNLKYIGGEAFENCDLHKVQIPKECEIYHYADNMVWQETGAFQGCGGYDAHGRIPPEYGITIGYY